MITLKMIKGQHIVTVDGEPRRFTTMSEAMKFIEAIHKSRSRVSS